MAHDSQFLLCLVLILLTGLEAVPTTRQRGAQVVRFDQDAINIDSLKAEVRQATQKHNEWASELVEALKKTFSVLQRASSHYNNDSDRFELNSACTLTSEEAKEEPEMAVHELVYHFEGLVANLEEEEVEEVEEMEGAVRELDCIRHTFGSMSIRNQEGKSWTEITSLDNRVRGVVRKLEDQLRTDRLKLDILDGSLVYKNRDVIGLKVSKIHLSRDDFDFTIDGLTESEVDEMFDEIVGHVPQDILDETILDDSLRSGINKSVVIQVAEGFTQVLENILIEADTISDDDDDESIWNHMMSRGSVCGSKFDKGMVSEIFDQSINQLTQAIENTRGEDEDEVEDEDEFFSPSSGDHSESTEMLACNVMEHYQFIATISSQVTEDQLDEVLSKVREIGERLVDLSNFWSDYLNDVIEEIEELSPIEPTGQDLDYSEDELPEVVDEEEGKKTVVRVETEVIFDNQCCDYNG